MMTTDLVAQATLNSPLGPLLLGATERGLAYLWFVDPEYHAVNTLEAPENPRQRWIAQATEELDGYWDGHCPPRFRVPLDLQGTAFQRAVWQALLEVPPGRTSTYGSIARQVGAPQAARAAGAAIKSGNGDETMRRAAKVASLGRGHALHRSGISLRRQALRLRL